MPEDFVHNIYLMNNVQPVHPHPAHIREERHRRRQSRDEKKRHRDKDREASPQEDRVSLHSRPESCPSPNTLTGKGPDHTTDEDIKIKRLDIMI